MNQFPDWRFGPEAIRGDLIGPNPVNWMDLGSDCMAGAGHGFQNR